MFEVVLYGVTVALYVIRVSLSVLPAMHAVLKLSTVVLCKRRIQKNKTKVLV